MKDSFPHDVFGYGVALILTALVVLAAGIFPTLQERGIFILSLAAVAITAWYGGLWPALLATALATLAAAWMLAPATSLKISDPAEIARVVLFVLVSVLIGSIYSSRETACRQRERAEQRMLVALDSARMAVWDADLVTGEFWWSPSLEVIFGRPPGEFSTTYDQFLGYIHPDSRDFLDRAKFFPVAGGRNYEVEHKITRPDKSTRWIITRGRVFEDLRGKAVRIVGVVTDITHLKEMEA